MATATIRATEVIRKEKISVRYALKMTLSFPKKSCENNFYGGFLQLQLGYFKQPVHMFSSFLKLWIVYNCIGPR